MITLGLLACHVGGGAYTEIDAYSGDYGSSFS